MYRVMRVLAANLKPKQLQVFLESVVLETVREDIRENGRMHPLYRRTLEKSMFKPAAFFQGLLLPLLNVSVAVLREDCELS
jgi:essential nuclear protein 1